MITQINSSGPFETSLNIPTQSKYLTATAGKESQMGNNTFRMLFHVKIRRMSQHFHKRAPSVSNFSPEKVISPLQCNSYQMIQTQNTSKEMHAKIKFNRQQPKHSGITSYQIYKSQQKINKFNQISKLSFIRQKSSVERSCKTVASPTKNNSHFNKSKIYDAIASVNFMTIDGSLVHTPANQLMMKQQQMIAKSREMYMKTSEGKRKKVDSNIYLRKIQNKYAQLRKQIGTQNSHFMTVPQNKNQTVTPFARSITPINTMLGEQSQRQRSVVHFRHTYWKTSKSQRIKPKAEFLSDRKNQYRPWSPVMFQNLLATDITSFCKGKKSEKYETNYSQTLKCSPEQ